MSVLNPLGFVSLKLHYTPKQTSNTGVPTQKFSVFSVQARVWVVVFTLYQTLKKQSCFDCQMQCLAYQDLTAVLSHVHLISSSRWLQHSEHYSFQIFCFCPLPSLSVDLSFSAVGKQVGVQTSTFPHSSIYSFCSDGASHTLWFIFTSSLQGIMEVLVLTVCAHI